jgi:RNAse (barnase) inhibitor barstar
MTIKYQIIAIGMSVSIVTAEPLLLLSSQLDQLQQTSITEKDRVKKIFQDWCGVSNQWAADLDRRTLMIAGIKFDPANISGTQATAIERACSWKGLAQDLGIMGERALQKRVVAKLLDAHITMPVKGVAALLRAEEIIELVDTCIMLNLSALVRSLINFVDTKKIIEQGDEIIKKPKKFLGSWLDYCMQEIGELCVENNDFKRVEEKYSLLRKFFKNHNIDDKYESAVRMQWCTVVEAVTFRPFEILLKKAIKKRELETRSEHMKRMERGDMDKIAQRCWKDYEDCTFYKFKGPYWQYPYWA